MKVRTKLLERLKRWLNLKPKYEKKSSYPPGQWSRWYQANRKRQRQNSALRHYNRGQFRDLKRNLIP